MILIIIHIYLEFSDQKCSINAKIPGPYFVKKTTMGEEMCEDEKDENSIMEKCSKMGMPEKCGTWKCNFLFPNKQAVQCCNSCKQPE